MQELQQALMRDRTEADESAAGATSSSGFSEALAPLGMSNEVAAPTTVRGSAWSGFMGADEVFLTSTIREIVPVTRLGERAVGTGRPGAVTHRLHRAFRRLAGGPVGIQAPR
jgi:hypothetical protein